MSIAVGVKLVELLPHLVEEEDEAICQGEEGQVKTIVHKQKQRDEGPEAIFQ